MSNALKKEGHTAAVKTEETADFWRYYTLFFIVCLSFFILTFLNGCSGGGGSSGATSTAEQVASYKMPTEISAVPTKTNATVSNQSFTKSLKALAKRSVKKATDAGTDYSKAVTKKYVEEHTLEQFDMIETILNAISQTNYNDHIGDGAYKSMVAFNDEENGVEVKSLEPWITKADAIVESGTSVLRVQAWIEEHGGYVKAEFKIYSPPTQNADGSYADYGEWVLNVKFDETGIDNFYAISCEATAEGALLKVHEKNTGHGPGEPSGESRSVMLRGSDSGYGKVSYPDYEAYWGPDGDRTLLVYPTITATYAYNATYLSVKPQGESVTYKNRNEVMEMTHRYGVFNNETGNDIMRSKSFGFPIRYTNNKGESMHSYYGAWQGRHQIWTDGDPIPIDTTVTRDDTPPDQVITYTMGPTFNGVLVRRDLVNATLNDIKDIPVEIWINNDYKLIYTGGSWKHCKQINWQGPSPTCFDTPVDFDNDIGLETLMVDPNNHRKHVNIGGRDNNSNTEKQFVYLKTGTYDFSGTRLTVTAPDFYEATPTGDHGSLVPDPSLTAIVPSNYDMLWVWMGGSIYVEYNGSDWVEKELLNFDERTWTPEFGTNDKIFNLPEGKELYINMQGANYIVNNDGGNISVKLELQTAVNPKNMATIVPENTIFKDSWNPDSNSKFELVRDSSDPKYMMLVFNFVGDNHLNQDPVPKVGDIASNVWGISAEIGGVTKQFNWEYSADGGWGSVSYLLDANGAIIYLDEALKFDPITVTNGAGDSKTLSLRFDGWMSGLPDMYHELQKTGWTITNEISSKVINLPVGTELTESQTGDLYILKPLEISQFLVSAATPDPADQPDITSADALNLDTVPNFVEHNMGTPPSGVQTLYSEGLPIE